ncbi:MAG: type I-B CRISPR-associated protein Cas5 [Caldisericia bacterium]|nr:type I-B CRISPR-associated protein Cas5 [Caldisericia bacterium]
MKVLVFDIKGKMAHFRKYYTNSSSLTYFFPPRTTINGLIAGIVGFERDSYYNLFSKDNSFVAISIKTKLRKIIQTVNYIWAEQKSELNLSKRQHTQIPLEIVIPNDFNDFVRYRVFFYQKEDEIFNKVIEAVINKKYKYPPYLGISEFIGDIEFINLKEPEILKDNKLTLSSVLNLDYLKNGRLIQKEDKVYIKERMPYDFNYDRKLSEEPKDFIVEINTGVIEFENENSLEYFKIDEDYFLFM